jgi:hypothetical protein
MTDSYHFKAKGFPILLGFLLLLFGFYTFREAYKDGNDFDRKFLIGLGSMLGRMVIIILVMLGKI